MRRLAFLCVLLAFAGLACNGDDPDGTASPTPRLEIEEGALERAALSLQDMGEGWRSIEDTPSTLQIGGRIGPANLKEAEQQATTAFAQDPGKASVVNSVFLLETADLAAGRMQQHRDATDDSWTQERADGGETRFRRTGEVNLPNLGEDMFTAAIDAVVVDAEGNETPRKLEYVAYRIDRIIAFVVAQDIAVSPYARKQERKLNEVIG